MTPPSSKTCASRRRVGITLIDLMIVVAIIGVLASIALPQYRRFQLRSKISEGRVNLVAIRAAEGAYFGEFGTFIQLAAEPLTGSGQSDIDADGQSAFYGLVVPNQAGVSAAPSPLAGCATVFDDVGLPGMVGAIGPCGVGMGFTIY